MLDKTPQEMIERIEELSTACLASVRTLSESTEQEINTFLLNNLEMAALVDLLGFYVDNKEIQKEGTEKAVTLVYLVFSQAFKRNLTPERTNELVTVDLPLLRGISLRPSVIEAGINMGMRQGYPGTKGGESEPTKH